MDHVEIQLEHLFDVRSALNAELIFIRNN